MALGLSFDLAKSVILINLAIFVPVGWIHKRYCRFHLHAPVAKARIFSRPPIAVLLGSQLRGQPFTSIDLQAGTSNHIMVNFYVPVGVEKGAITAVIGNLEDLVGQFVGQILARARVLVPKFYVACISQPAHHHGFGRHAWTRNHYTLYFDD